MQVTKPWRSIVEVALRPFLWGLPTEVQEGRVYENPKRFAAIGLVMVFLGGYLVVLGEMGIFPFRRMGVSFRLLPVFLFATGATFWVLAGVLLRFLVQARSEAVKAADAKKIEEPTYRHIEEIRKDRERLEEGLFQRNLEENFVLRSFQWEGVRSFEDGVYRFAPRVNVLLGKNGYGKTLLLRILAALLQRDLEHSGQVFEAGLISTSEPGRPSIGQRTPLMRVEVTRERDTEYIVRDATYFEDSVGKIPLLAIPDSRFVNRSIRTIGSSATAAEPLSRSGARQFITQEPYEAVVQELLSQLCIEYIEGKSLLGSVGFKRPIFRLIEEVVSTLTEDENFAFHRIQRTGRTGFEILVRTAGSGGSPLPIQYASQGTLSVVSIFGLIYSFLRSLRPNRHEEAVLTTPGIVMIDEIDAHLHPSWQQKILSMLTSKFPNVQFIVSSQSPLIVAGCDSGEVSVLRRKRGSDHFYVETMEQDFLGATARELYEHVFEIEDVDRLYLQYTTKITMPGQDERQREIERLADIGERTPKQEERLKKLLVEARLIERASDAREQHLKTEDTKAYIRKLETQIEELKATLNRKESKVEPKTNGLP